AAPLSAPRVGRAQAGTAAARGVSPPREFAWAKDLADRIEAARGPLPLVPCHDDLLNANFIDDGTRIRIVDWEYAGMGDRFFDLGNFSVKHDLDVEHDEVLLRSYAGDVRAADLASVRLMRFMGAFFESMWGVVQQAISELDFDFVAYARENFERLRAIGSDPRFPDRLLAERDRSRIVQHQAREALGLGFLTSRHEGLASDELDPLVELHGEPQAGLIGGQVRGDVRAPDAIPLLQSHRVDRAVASRDHGVGPAGLPERFPQLRAELH